ncbi:MAG: proline racemase family protein [Bryobacterales bacterium]|nr:proline racemase family protein [Bryobacterales bacterium]
MRIQVVDSHTAGEPTRVVIHGAPALEPGSMVELRNRLQQDHDWLRSAVVNEPRGSDVLVGALLAPPVDPSAAAGVVFFNNVGYLGMCGHGMIGVVATLAHLGRIGPGKHRLETPVGPVTVTLYPDGDVSITNVPSYRYQAHVSLNLPRYGTLHGDVAWGGNWFFLCSDHGLNLELASIRELMDLTAKIREYLPVHGIAGENGAEIDHIELTGPPLAGGHGRNFVLCPGLAYDRSPCGTGTSAKLACLAAEGKLAPGDVWIQEGILGTAFHGSYQPLGENRIAPLIRGRAYICAESTLLLDPADPFRHGIHPPH